MRTRPPGILPLISVDRNSAKPLYRQLYEGYRDAVVDRQLRGGQRIPSTRSLASELQISRIPVLSAFEQLLAEGYFESRVGAGTFVARSLPEELSTPTMPSAARKTFGRPRRRIVARASAALVRRAPGPWLGSVGAFNMGQPPVDHFPAAVWSKLVARHNRNPHSSLLHFQNAMGLRSLREVAAEYLRTARAVRCEANQIMIVSGSQQALDLSARVLLDAGSPVWVEEPGYFGSQNVLLLAGARLVPIPVDEEGLDVAVGIARCPRARCAFVTPSHQFPLGVTMSAPRRLQLLDWARRNGSWIIEDDYDSEYRYGSLPIGSLQGLDRDDRVIYIGTFTKILYPALRLGYIALPRDLISPFTQVRSAMDFFSPTFHQEVLADFIREGHFARHIRRIRLLCQERRAALVEAIEKERLPLEVLGDRAGMFLSAALPKGQRDRDISLRAARQGVWAAPLSECYLGRARRQGLVLGYSGASASEIADGVHKLSGAFGPA